jgi:hypothetical protein
LAILAPRFTSSFIKAAASFFGLVHAMGLRRNGIALFGRGQQFLFNEALDGAQIHVEELGKARWSYCGGCHEAFRNGGFLPFFDTAIVAYWAGQLVAPPFAAGRS